MATRELWDETEGILDDVERLCAETDDTECVERCLAKMLSIEECFENANLDAAKLIKKCTSMVEEAKLNAEDIAARTPTSPEIEALENERAALENRIREQTVEKEQVDNLITQMEKNIERLQGELEQIKAESQDQLPVLKHSLSLFANVSKIKWNFMQSDPAIVEGSVINAETGQVKKFSINSKEKNTFQVTNELWDMIKV